MVKSINSNGIAAIRESAWGGKIIPCECSCRVNFDTQICICWLVIANCLNSEGTLVLLTVDGKHDPLQLAYQAGRGVDDVKLLILSNLYKQLGKPQAHARLWFADFSSTFNTMKLHFLIERLLCDSVCLTSLYYECWTSWRQNRGFL